jgi:hypothetical protein
MGEPPGAQRRIDLFTWCRKPRWQSSARAHGAFSGSRPSADSSAAMAASQT